MDSLTQIVLGASVGEAVLGKKVGNKAMLFGAIAGTIPDLDVLSRYILDTVTAIEWHRGFSHSIFFAVLFAPIFGWLVWRFLRPREATWKEWSLLFFMGLVTHPILDAFTTWGTQLFWPLPSRLAFQSIFVIDPLYTLPFLFFLILTMRQRRGAAKRRRYNVMGLAVSSGYLLLTLVLKGFAYHTFTNNLQEQGIVYDKIDVRPTAFNTILWTANIDAEDAYLIGNYSFLDTQPIQFVSYPKNHLLLGSLTLDDKVQRLIKITEGWYCVREEEDQLYFNDMRFGLISLDKDETKFAFSYKLIESNNGLMVLEMPKMRSDVKALLASLWKRILGN